MEFKALLQRNPFVRLVLTDSEIEAIVSAD
jgi:hypothetical protein